MIDMENSILPSNKLIMWLFIMAALVLMVAFISGCTQYNLTVNKNVVAYPRAHVEMNSTTNADGNTSNPTTTAEPELDVTVPMIP